MMGWLVSLTHLSKHLCKKDRVPTFQKRPHLFSADGVMGLGPQWSRTSQWWEHAEVLTSRRQKAERRKDQTCPSKTGHHSIRAPPPQGYVTSQNSVASRGTNIQHVSCWGHFFCQPQQTVPYDSLLCTTIDLILKYNIFKSDLEN